MPKEIFKMSANPKSKEIPSDEMTKEYTVKMRASIHDYGNEFISLKMLANFGGIKEVHKIMEEHKVKTFEEYRAEKDIMRGADPHTMLTAEEYKANIVQNKVKELNEFAHILNNEGTTISKEKFEKIISRAEEILYDKDTHLE